MTDLLSDLKKIYAAQSLPEHDGLLVLTDEAITVLEHESSSYRPPQKTDDGEKGGGLLDFTALSPLPLIVVPDLHARCDFFLHLLERPLWQLALPLEGRVLDGLSRGTLRLVCLGDLFHSEKRGMMRWISAWEEYLRGNDESEAMIAEMKENLTLFQMVLRVKNAFPDYFHFLKGNHENILNEGGGGNFPFRKFADEGNMVYDFMASHYGDALLHVISLWEHALPLCAVFPHCVLSHAEPKHAYPREKMISCDKNPDLIQGLTWTANDEADEGSVQENLIELLGKEDAEKAVWISGHRPVREVYALRQQGKLIQIHNPLHEQVAVVQTERAFNPETDMIRLR